MGTHTGCLALRGAADPFAIGRPTPAGRGNTTIPTRGDATEDLAPRPPASNPRTPTPAIHTEVTSCGEIRPLAADHAFQVLVDGKATGHYEVRIAKTDGATEWTVAARVEAKTLTGTDRSAPASQED